MKRHILITVIVILGLSLVFMGGSMLPSHARAQDSSPQGPRLESVLAGPQSPQTAPVFSYHSMDTNYKFCSAVSAADVDRDGDMDVLSANEEGGGVIHWWANPGDGQFLSVFKNSVDYSSRGATSLYSDDLDEDGDMDIVAISTTYSKFASFENLGTGYWKRWDHSAFGAVNALSPRGVEVSGDPRILMGAASTNVGLNLVIPFPSGSILSNRIASFQHVSALYPDDINRDGYVDYVAASKYGNLIAWYETPWGTGGYTQHTIDSAFSRPIWVQTGDLDQDGDADVVAASDTKGLFWWENKDGKGTSWTRHLITQQEFYLAPSLHLVDLDNDGDLDMTAGTKQQLVWWENLGSPDKTAGWVRHLVETNTYAYSQGYALFPTDIDGDGQVDIVACDLMASLNGQPTRLGWWENGTEPPAADDLTFWSTSVGTLTGAWGVDLADFNGDGRLDVAAAGYGSGSGDGKIGWWRNPGGIELPWTRAYTETFDKSRGVTAYAAGRSQPHIQVSSNANTGEVRDFYSSDWNWNSPHQWTRLSGLDDTYMSVVADLNNDGILDVVGASAENNDILWARSNASSGVWAQLKIEDNCAGARAVCTGDIDGDGDLDVAAACQNENRIYWWKNNNDGATWTKQSVPVFFAGATDIECADINNDGEVEMIAASPGWWAIAWFKPNASIGNSDTMGWVTDTFTDVQHIEVADIDRDGDLDVAATSHQLDELAWFENEGTSDYLSYFTYHSIDTFLDGAREVAVGDINSNGVPDIVVAAQNKNGIYWYQAGVGVDVSVQKWLDTSISTGVISTGQSIPYIIETTNMGPPGADMLIIDTWDPPNAVAAASGPGCVSDIPQGVMTCTLPTQPAGAIRELNVVITPTLSFDGYITNTATVILADIFFNTNIYDTVDEAVPVLVQRDPSLCDLTIKPGFIPDESFFPGGSFSYSMVVTNLGPKALTPGVMLNQWSPASAIADFTILGDSSPSSSQASAAYNCTTDPDVGEVICEFDDLAANEPVTITIQVTTSDQFTDVLEAAISISGEDEGFPANNQTWPIRVGLQPLNKIYLPLVWR